MRKNTHVPEPEDNPGTKADLRLRAEKRLRDGAENRKNPEKPGEVQKLIHELQVHQIELEIQNEELVRTRDEVEAGLERFTELYDFAPVGYFTLDRTGMIRNVNLTGASMLGIERSQLLNQHFMHFVSKNSLPAFTTIFSAAFEHNTSSACDAELLPQGNPPIYAIVRIRVLNKGRECLMALQDITERKFMEELLRDSENKSRILLEQIPAILWTIDKDLRITSLTGSGLAPLNLAPDQVAGMSLSEFFHTKDPDFPVIREHMHALSGNAVTYEQAWAGRVWESHLEPARNPSHEITGVIGVAFDVTAHKDVVEKLRKFSEDLERKVLERTAEITDTNQKLIAEIAIRLDAEKHLEDSLGQKEVLLREIHHRVKNNLQIIISLTNLQMRQVDDERLKQVMAETQNRVRAMSLVHEKLYLSEDISRIDLGSYTRFLVTHLFSYYGIEIRQVALHIDIGKIMLSINTAIPLGLIINELVSNTLKHAFPKGRTGTLSIAVREDERRLSLTLSDDGAGLPAGFDWRHAESLGLRLVISLVGQLDGTIELDRSVGTAFVIVVQEKE